MHCPDQPGANAPRSTAAANQVVEDARISAALDWCAIRGIKELTVAAPFPLSMGELDSLLAQPSVVSAVVLRGDQSRTASDSIGEFLPADYSWRLPSRLGRHIVYIGGRDSITARMIQAALVRGTKSVVCWDLDCWAQRGIPSLAGHKIWSKVGALTQALATRAGTAAKRGGAAALRTSIVAAARLRGQRLPKVGPGQADESQCADAFSLLPGATLLEAPTHRQVNRLLGARSRSLKIREPCMTGRIVMACPTLVAGGAERQIVNTAIGLRNRIDADVSILVSRLFSPPGNDFFHDELVESGVDVREVQSPTSTAESWARHQASPSEQTLLKLRELLKRLPAELSQEVANLYLMLRELRPAVVHAWLDHSSVCAGLAGLLAGVPRVLLSGRNVSPVHFAYILQPYMRPAYRAMAMRPEAVFVNNSQGGAADYADWLGLDIRRFNIIYNGLNLVRSKVPTPTQTTDLRRRHGIPDHAFLVGGMFRLSPEKRPLLWAETLSRIVTTRPHVYGLLFGAGAMKGELETYLKQSGVADRIFLSPPTKDSATALAAFDVLLLTSRWEGTPNVAIEAQAAGTPVVVSGGGGAAEALDHGRTGIFVPHSDADALAPAVISLIEDAALRQRLAAAGPTFVTTRFGLDRMLSETLRLYGIPASTKPHAPTRRGDPLAGSAIAERTRCE